jgi:quinoprotein glucose dehydrogenase
VSHQTYRLVILVLVLAISGPLILSGRQTANPTRALPRTVQLSPAEAAAEAAEARNGVTVEMPAGVELKLWASDRLIVDPVALEFDPSGTLYATSTSRNNMPLDIRDHPTWVPTVHTSTRMPRTTFAISRS